MKLFDIFKKIDQEAFPRKESNPLREKAIQIMGILSDEDKITILKYKSIPEKYLNIFENNSPLFYEVFNLVDKYYKL